MVRPSTFTGSGAIVDGSWLGSTTISLAMGLEKNKITSSSKGVIHAYDEFVWRDYMERSAGKTSLKGQFQLGESFVGEFNKRIVPWKELIVVYQGDLSQIKWEGGIVEFLLIDAMKSWDLTNNILKSFFPALKPWRELYPSSGFCPLVHALDSFGQLPIERLF